SCRCEREAPYTPFGVASALPEVLTASAAPAPSTSASAAPFVRARAVRAPEGSTRVVADGFTLTAPGGQRIALALSSDFDGDHEPDAVAWTVPRDGAGGELWYYPSSGAPRRAHALPSFVPTENCALIPTLEH